VTAAVFRRIALGLNGAVEGAHMGHPDFRANGRIFASLHPGGMFGMIKLTPEQQQRVLKTSPGAFSQESGAWGRSGCTRVTLAAIDAEALGEAMTLAWQNTAAGRSAAAPRTAARRAIAPRASRAKRTSPK
jgi:hypothetical protein